MLSEIEKIAEACAAFYYIFIDYFTIFKSRSAIIAKES
jgi:hypothetical protein